MVKGPTPPVPTAQSASHHGRLRARRHHPRPPFLPRTRGKWPAGRKGDAQYHTQERGDTTGRGRRGPDSAVPPILAFFSRSCGPLAFAIPPWPWCGWKGGPDSRTAKPLESSVHRTGPWIDGFGHSGARGAKEDARGGRVVMTSRVRC